MNMTTMPVTDWLKLLDWNTTNPFYYQTCYSMVAVLASFN